MEVHHVIVHDIGCKGQALELWAFPDRDSSCYDTYYLGVPEPGMEAYEHNDLHLNSDPGSWWGWGYLENSSAKTTEWYRPAGYEALAA